MPAHAQTLPTAILASFTHTQVSGTDIERESHGITVPSSVGAPYYLVVKGGTIFNPPSITQLDIAINGAEVFGAADLFRNLSLGAKAISLQTINTLDFALAAPAGSSVKVTVLGTPVPIRPANLTPSPLAIQSGATGTLTAILTPIPQSAGQLLTLSSKPLVALPNPLIAYAANQGTISVPVKGLLPGNAVISVYGTGGSSSANISVTNAAAAVSSLLPASLAIEQGASSNLIITLNSVRKTATTVLLTASSNSVVSVPASVAVPAGSLTANVLVAALAAGTTQVKATLGTSTATSTVTVSPTQPTLVSLLPVTSQLTLGASSALTVAMSGAQTVATTIALTSAPAMIVGLPTSVTIPPGQITATIPVSALALGTAMVRASLTTSSVEAAVQVLPPLPAITSLAPTQLGLLVGASGGFTLTLNAVQTTDTIVPISVGNSAVLQAPSSVIVPAGLTTATFTALGMALGTTQLSATLNGVSHSATVTVSAPAPSVTSLQPPTLALQAGATSTLAVQINAAQPADTAVMLSTAPTGILQTPASVTVASGSLSGVFPITGLRAGSATVTASLPAGASSAVVTVKPPPVAISAITPSVLSLAKGKTAVLNLAVNPAPSVPTVVTLAASSGAIDIPATVTVPVGQPGVAIPVVAMAEGTTTVTATLNGASSTASVTVTPAEVVAVALSPLDASAFVGDTVPLVATATLTDGTQRNDTNSVVWSSSAPTVATIATTGVATALAPGVMTINASDNGVVAATTLTVLVTPSLTLVPAVASLRVGDSATFSVSLAQAAPASGVSITLTSSGLGALNVPTGVTIPGGQSATSFSVSGATAGLATLIATAPRYQAAESQVTVLPAIAISAVSPAAAPVGSPVTISGLGFDPNPAGNDVRFNGVVAIVSSATAGSLNVIVPTHASNGPITVTNALGAAQSPNPFTVQALQDFDISLAPASIQVPLGGVAAGQVSLVSGGLTAYRQPVTLALTGLPAGASYRVEPASLSTNVPVTLSIAVASSTAPGIYPLVLTASGLSGIATVTRSKALTLTVLPANTTTVSGRVLHTEDDSPFVNARVRLGTDQAMTDAAGYYRFVNPVLRGDQVLLIDGNTANTASTEYASAIAMPVVIAGGQDNVALSSYIGAVDTSKFTAITPGAVAAVTSAEIPNFSLNIPQGAVLTGGTGQPVTKISVRTVPVDRLPIKPVPAGTTARSVYLYYFFGPGGANPSQPIPVTMNNDLGLSPGDKADLWYYDESLTPDPNSNQWRIMGQGTVSADGRAIVSDPGVGIPKFCCGASMASPPPPPTPPGGNGCGPGTAYPVDLASGIGSHMEDHSLGINGLLPVSLGCGYNSRANRIGYFGVGTFMLNYDWQMTAGADAITLITPEGIRYNLARDTNNVFRSTGSKSGADGMTATVQGSLVVLQLPQGTRYEFGSFGRGNRPLTGIVDPSGNRIAVHRDGSGIVTDIVDGNGRKYLLQMSGNLINQITDPIGRIQTFAYDASSRLVQVTDPLGGITQYGYDANNRIVQKTDRRGAVTKFDYDADGRTIKETLANGTSNQMAYTVAGSIVTQTVLTDRNGNVTTWRFDGQGYPSKRIDALGRVSLWNRDYGTGRLLSETDPLGRVTRYTYDANGNRNSVKDPSGNITVTDYDPIYNLPLQVTDALGNRTQFSYNAQGKLATLTTPDNQTTKLTYTIQGRIETLTDPLGHVSAFTYDAQGNPIQASDALGNISRLGWDTANRPADLTDPLGRNLHNTYDALDRLTARSDANGGITQLDYDANGNLTRVTDPRGNAIETRVLDLMGRITGRTDAANRSTTAIYDGNDNVRTITDRNGRLTTLSYDALNRVVSQQDGDGRTINYFYDLAGNLARIADSGNGDILFGYDELDRLTQVVTDQGTVG
jgi:YD repeat-containing protein